MRRTLGLLLLFALTGCAPFTSSGSAAAPQQKATVTAQPEVAAATGDPDAALDEVCADPQAWFDFGAGAGELVLNNYGQQIEGTSLLDEGDAALFARHSRDAARMAEDVEDAELKAALEATAKTYGDLAAQGKVSLDESMFLLGRDKAVYDRCVILNSESDLPE